MYDEQYFDIHDLWSPDCCGCLICQMKLEMETDRNGLDNGKGNGFHKYPQLLRTYVRTYVHLHRPG